MRKESLQIAIGPICGERRLVFSLAVRLGRDFTSTHTNQS
jgi:hypothetical protein